MTENIIRCTFNDFNDSKNPRTLLMKPSLTKNIIENPSEYEVSVEKFRIPNSSKFRPIDMIKKPYYINLYYDSKTIIHPNLVYGNNFFPIMGPIYSVEEFIQKMNDIVLKKPQPNFTLCRFSLEYVGETPTIYLTINTGDLSNFALCQIFIDTRITNLFNFTYDLSSTCTFNEEELIELVPYSGKTEQNAFSYDLFYKIESICVNSNLPVGPNYFSESINNSLYDSNVLYELYFNASQNLFNNSILYIPTLKISNCLLSSSALTNIEYWFTYKYSDSSEISLVLDKNESARLTLVFEKINKN